MNSIPENSIELSNPIKKELDNRLESRYAKKMEYYTIDEVRDKLCAI